MGKYPEIQSPRLRTLAVNSFSDSEDPYLTTGQEVGSPE